MTSYVMGAQRGSQTKAQLFAALTASTSGLVAPEMMMIWKQDRDRTPGQNRQRLTDPTGKKTWYKMGTFFWGLLFAVGGPALLMPYRSGQHRRVEPFLLPDLAGGVFLAGLLCVVGLMIYISIEREQPRRVTYPPLVYGFYALWSLIGAGMVIGRALTGEPIEPGGIAGVVVVIAVAVAYVVMVWLVNKRMLAHERGADQHTGLMSPEEVQAAVDRRMSKPAGESDGNSANKPVERMNGSELRAAVDRELLEHIARVRTSRDDYDEEKFQRELIGGIEGLCKRGLISSNEAGWMLEQTLI